MKNQEEIKDVAELTMEYSEKLNQTLYDWIIYHQKEIVFNQCTYFGVPALKNPFDAWIYQEILFEVKPDIVIEIGSAHGGSTLFLAHVLELIGNGEVISIDKDRSTYRVSHKCIIEVTGDSSSQKVFEEVNKRCAGKKVLIIHDGDHRYETVLHELHMYSPLVSVGSYFIVEDSIVDFFQNEEIGFEGKGPLYAIHEFVSENRGFRIDDIRERYVLTYNPFGFLIRIY